MLLVASAAAQAPDIIHYNFDAGDATNSAVPGVGDGIPNAGVLFGAGPCSNGAATSDGAASIDSGWTVDIGTSSFTIGMTIDLTVGPKKSGRKDKDNPVSWIREYGKGRVFYCSLGHHAAVFRNRAVLRHWLAGVQYALGDLDADAKSLQQPPSKIAAKSK